MIKDSLSSVFGSWDPRDKKSLREAVERRESACFDHLRPSSDNNLYISAQRPHIPLSREELGLELGWRQMDVGPVAMTTSCDMLVLRQLFESSGKNGDDTLRSALTCRHRIILHSIRRTTTLQPNDPSRLHQTILMKQ